jgi:hypothetical protein
MITLNNHARKQIARRNLSLDDIEYIVQFGAHFHQAGVLFYFLRDEDIPVSDQQNSELERLAGTAVVLSKDGQHLLTAWRNRERGLKHIKRKVKYSLTLYQLGRKAWVDQEMLARHGFRNDLLA